MKRVSSVIRNEVGKILDDEPTCWHLQARIRELIPAFELIEQRPVGNRAVGYPSQYDKDVALYDSQWAIRELHKCYKINKCSPSLDDLLSDIL